jgi:hypothetical protein
MCMVCVFAPLVDGVRVHHGDADPGGQREGPPAGRVPGDSHPVQRLGWSPGPQQEEGWSPGHAGRWQRQLMPAAGQAGVAQERTETDAAAGPRNKRVHLARCCADFRRNHLYIVPVRLYMPQRLPVRGGGDFADCHVIVRHTGVFPESRLRVCPALPSAVGRGRPVTGSAGGLGVVCSLSAPLLPSRAHKAAMAHKPDDECVPNCYARRRCCGALFC